MLEIRIENMSSQTYWELLKRPEWQKKRLEKLNEAEFCCSCCFGDSKQLHVHHKRYVKGRKPWEYEDFELAVLCDECHTNAHEEMVRVNEIFAHLPYDGPNSNIAAVSLIAGFNQYGLPDDLIEKNFDLKSQPEFYLGEIAATISYAIGSEALKGCASGVLPKEVILNITRELIANYSKQEDLNELIHWHKSGRPNEL
jgi:hypothetical protein